MEMKKTFKNKSGACNEAIGEYCKICKSKVIYNSDIYDVDLLQELEANFMERHQHGLNKNGEMVFNHFETIYEIGKTPKKT